MSDLEKSTNDFHEVLKEVLSPMDLETAQYFLEIIQEKLADLRRKIDEQKRSQENSGSSR